MKRSLIPSLLRRVRIHGGEFGASARAMHRKAALENVSMATIERKLMSTKTTFKRIALVAVAAVGFGMLTGVAANATAPTAVITTGYAGAGTAAGTQVPGGQSSFTLTTTDATTNVAVSGVGTVVSSTIAGTTPGITYGTNSFSMPAGTGNLVITSAVAGVTTVTLTPILAGGVPGTAVTATVTWSAAVVPTLKSSTAFISTTTTAPATADSTAISSTATASATPVARITVNQYSTTDTTTVLATANTTAVTASISGAGSVSTAANGTTTGPSVTISAGSASPAEFYIYSNGVAGTGTISISVNGVVTSTKSVTFYGTLASYKLAAPSNTVIGVGQTGTEVVSGLDSNGNAATLGAITVTSGTPAVATVATSGGTITITGVAVGTSVITVANAATSPTVTSTFTVTVGKATAKTVTISTDKTSYAAGEKITLTVKAVGSDGTAVGDNTAFAAFSSAGMSSNVALQGFPTPSATVALVGGVATYTFYAPVTDGTVNITATEGAGTDSTTKGTISASFDVTNPGSSAAVDAANAATDAANYAADAADAATTAAQEATAAAQAAQDSADAATAAVVALGLRVDTLMASVRAQLTSLSNLLVRLIKKAHA